MRRGAWIDSDDRAASTCSLATQDHQKCAPPGVQNALCQSTTGQCLDIQVLDNDRLVCIRVPLRGLEMEVPALALDFQMGLCHTARHLSSAATALFAGAQASLLAAQQGLTGSKETWVRNRVPFAISQKDLQANINADGPTISD